MRGNCLKAAGGVGRGLISKCHAKELGLSLHATGNRQLPVAGGVQANTAANFVRLCGVFTQQRRVNAKIGQL